ncbi:hypothetical protein IFM89_020634 [Coptis chinensis]|uniref:Neprosin PEP catalytic domain-containing protein n=1 Tax=Coptis chinensis TaxID=261450 RepID=A0A835I9C9_9MAGN|nr:hypothetical protein IFM89_020634 [Coptis chinensis]
MGFMASLALLFLGLGYSYVEGMTNLSKEEDLELEEQVNMLNKPPIKTVKDEVGDIFDCVDIEKQPAFDHLLLKNHKLQTKPSFNPVLLTNNGVASTSTHSRTLPKRVGCPQGTVPIRRTRKEDLIRAKTFSESYFATISPLTTEKPGQHVSPQLFGDNNTRLFSYYKGKDNKGCFNILCFGFVQVDKDHPIGQVLPHGDQVEMPLAIAQDVRSRNWWLLNVDKAIQYGYWPYLLFSHMEEGGSQGAWGGVAIGDAGQPSPPMGSGTFPNDVAHASYIKRLAVTDADYRFGSPDRDTIQRYADVPKCYGVTDYGVRKEGGYTFMYGGPGGQCGD